MAIVSSESFPRQLRVTSQSHTASLFHVFSVLSPWADFCLLYKQDYVFPNGFIARMKRFGYIRCAITVSDLIDSSFPQAVSTWTSFAASTLEVQYEID